MKKRKRGLVVTVSPHKYESGYVVVRTRTGAAIIVCQKWFERAFGGKFEKQAKYRITVAKEGA